MKLSINRTFVRRTITVWLLLVSLIPSGLRALGAKIPMTSDAWEIAGGKVEVLKLGEVQALKLLPGAKQVVLKGYDFANGTIEYDFMPDRPDFVGLYFRRDNAAEAEDVYFRTWNAEKPAASGTLQYAPMVKGVLLWDMFGCYESACSIHSNQWNHVKLVVSGAQMRIFVNDRSHPVLEIPRLEGNAAHGGLAIEGSACFANLEIRPDDVEGLPSADGIDPTHNDHRYLRHWQVSEPADLPRGRELFSGDLPKAGTQWRPIDAERRGLINLTRDFGKSESRRVVWLRVNLHAATEMRRRLDLGFSDEVWVFLNGGLAYVDKNLYQEPIRKSPAGRCSTENASFDVRLHPGDNELLLGVANDFYGWGIVARLDSLDDLEIIR